MHQMKTTAAIEECERRRRNTSRSAYKTKQSVPGDQSQPRRPSEKIGCNLRPRFSQGRPAGGHQHRSHVELRRRRRRRTEPGPGARHGRGGGRGPGAGAVRGGVLLERGADVPAAPRRGAHGGGLLAGPPRVLDAPTARATPRWCACTTTPRRAPTPSSSTRSGPRSTPPRSTGRFVRTHTKKSSLITALLGMDMHGHRD